MQTWNLTAGDPLALTLSADARLTATSYTDDQIWELSLGGGEPAALALQTTYGLRAHWMRLFPRFVRLDAAREDHARPRAWDEVPSRPRDERPRDETTRPRADQARVDPAGFTQPPRLTHFAPNYLAVTFAPFEGLEVQAEYWAAESQVVMGRIGLTNHSILPQHFNLEWVALLNPIDRQGGMTPLAVGPSFVLTGETGNLQPVVMITGGPTASSSPFPALVHELEIYPGNTRQFTWAAASLTSQEASLDAARRATGRSWEAEHARVNLYNASQAVQIQTGNPEWDAAFALTQKTAFELLQKNAPQLPQPSFVLNRRPDQGYSPRGDGCDYPYAWSGQTALDAYFLASLLLPGAPELAAGLVRNFLSVQDENGLIDWKPGLGGQRGRRLAQPMLASLAEQVGRYLRQPDWYQEVFPPLLRFFNNWFGAAYDQDGDGFPEWEHPLQTGIEDSPIFDRWSPRAQGIRIERLECPSLAAMLYRECLSLIHMAQALTGADQDHSAAAAYARLTGGPALEIAQEALPGLYERQAALREALESTYDEQNHIYRYRDFRTHLSLPGDELVEFSGPGKAAARKRFQQPRRLILHLKVSEERTFSASFTIHGITQDGETSETITPRQFTWLGAQARATTENAFLALKRIEAQGLEKDDLVQVKTADYTQEDFSLLLPLWAGSPEPDRALDIIRCTLLTRYLQDYGIPLCPPDKFLQDALPGMHSACSSALMPWNHLLGEGLLRYGCQAEAAELVTRLMGAVVGSLKNHQSFRQYYHAENGLAAGERGHLYGLAPLGLFLQTVGIQKLSAREILLDGFNPYPWPIHVQYHQVRLTCLPDRTIIQFPGGQSVTVDQAGPQRVTLAEPRPQGGIP